MDKEKKGRGEKLIRDTFFDVIDVAWPTLVIFLVIIIIIRIGYLKNNHKKFVFYSEGMNLLFLVYILLLFELVTMKDVSVVGGTNFIPFTEIMRYKIGSTLFYQQVVGNIILFIPFGYFASYYVKIKKPFIAFIITLLSSAVIETVQYYIGRSFDIDDIILNVVGGLIGFLLYYFLEVIRKKLPSFFQKPFFYNLVMILFFGLLALYFLNFFNFGGI